MVLRLAQFVCCGLRTAKSTVVTLIFFCATRSGNFVGVFLARLHVTYLMPKLWDTTPPRWRPEVSEKQKALQRAKKVVSDSPGLEDFAIGLVNSVFNLPDGQVMFYEEFE